MIISRLMQNKCIDKKYDSSLPCSSHFVRRLFQKYGETSIKKENMTKLLTELNIATEEEAHGHGHSHGDGSHEHRRRRSFSIPMKPLEIQYEGKLLDVLRRHKRAVGDDHSTQTDRYKKVKASHNFLGNFTQS